MPSRSVAAQEIDQTLRLARDEAEARIARYRVWAFTAAVAITVLIDIIEVALGKRSVLVPTVSFSVAVVYALVLRAIVGRIGAQRWLVLATLSCDLLVCCAPFVVVNGVASAEVREQGLPFASHIAGTSIGLVLMLNGLRGDAVASVFGSAFASVLAFAALVPIEGFHLAQVAMALIFWIMGGVGVAAARQARRTLDSFARLQLLRRYLSPAAVERVMRDHPDAALSLGGRLVTVTLLSADLRGFTAMSEALSPDEVVKQLNEFHGAMLEQIEAHGGVLDKFIGDGILVVFGFERATERGGTNAGEGDAGARHAVDCAHAMFRALESLNEVRGRRGEAALRMGVGVHTGPVVAGNIGAPGRRLEFTVIGDAVNTASRLEGMTKEVGTPLLVSAATAERLHDAHDLRELAAVTARGKTTAIRVFGLAETPG
jgi:class 3 adenylate cyclase